MMKARDDGGEEEVQEGMVDMVVEDDEDEEKGYGQDMPIGPDMLSMECLTHSLSGEPSRRLRGGRST
jgi:hypothetical protein